MTRLAVAAILDARDVAASTLLKPVQVIGFLVGMGLSSTVCRVRGHEVRVIACPEVTRLCVRCGVEGAR